jgi:hypothetical protein
MEGLFVPGCRLAQCDYLDCPNVDVTMIQDERAKSLLDPISPDSPIIDHFLCLIGSVLNWGEHDHMARVYRTSHNPYPCPTSVGALRHQCVASRWSSFALGQIHPDRVGETKAHGGGDPPRTTVLSQHQQMQNDLPDLCVCLLKPLHGAIRRLNLPTQPQQSCGICDQLLVPCDLWPPADDCISLLVVHSFYDIKEL